MGTRKEKGMFKKTNCGQVIIEFTFCMIVVFLMIFGLAKVFTWTGRDLAERSIAHDRLLASPVDPNYQCVEVFVPPDFDPMHPDPDIIPKCLSYSGGPSLQIDPYFYTPVKMDAIWNGN
jgi:hypothetical protein